MKHSEASLTKFRNIIHFAALGTHWAIEIETNDDSAKILERKILLTVNDFEQAYSRFLPDSLLSQLNDHGELLNPPDELRDMLLFALNMHEKTSGLFNISVGGVLESRGYGRKGIGTVADNLSQAIHLSHDKITFSQPIRIDFGGFGKGWLFDQIGDLLQKNGCTQYVINGGGDISVQANTPQSLSIEHPIDDKQFIGYVQLVAGALASSSNRKRTWNYDGKRFVHIIHPSTQPIAAELASIHVHAHNATVSDTVATALFVATPSQRPIIARRCGVEYMEVGADLSSYRTADFPFQQA